MSSSRNGATSNRPQIMKKQLTRDVRMMHPHELAKDLHSLVGTLLVLDCRPILAYNSCHIQGAVNVNFTNMTKRRFMSGSIALSDLVTTEEGREKFKTCTDWPTVVYDEGSCDYRNLTSSNALRLVLVALEEMGKDSYVLQGGLSEFNVLHPSLCEISLPSIRQTLTPAALKASTPGVRDQPLDWQTAPPVHVLKYLVLGGKKDASSREVFQDFKINYVLNVTPSCPNYFEEREDLTYMRISVTDTGSQKLSDKFHPAFEFIEKARNTNSVVLIHCMAGVSRSVTLTIAYIMYYFGLTMQSAYQLVKDRRPAISPNLNFMGQLVAFEQDLKETQSDREMKNVHDFMPTDDQEKLTDNFQLEAFETFGPNLEDRTPSPKPKINTPSTGSAGVGKSMSSSPFVLKLPMGRNIKGKLVCAAAPRSPVALNLKNSPTLREEADILPNTKSANLKPPSSGASGKTDGGPMDPKDDATPTNTPMTEKRAQLGSP